MTRTISSQAASKEQKVQRPVRKDVDSSESKRGVSSKVCRICGTEKSLDDFYFRKDNNTHRSECKECTKEREKYRKFGVCNVKYDEMLTKQRGVCAVCGCILNSSRYTKFAIDHDHRTGKVRGLLCTNCNTGLGCFKDSHIRLQAAVNYLQRHDDKDMV